MFLNNKSNFKVKIMVPVERSCHKKCTQHSKDICMVGNNNV